MPGRVWTYNLKAGETLTLSPKTLLIVTNAALASDAKDDQRSSLQLGHGTLLETGLPSKTITVSTFNKNKNESARLKIEMQPSHTYTLTALGENNIDLLGYIPGTPASALQTDHDNATRNAAAAEGSAGAEAVKTPIQPKKPAKKEQSPVKKEPAAVAESISTARRSARAAAPSKPQPQPKTKAPAAKAKKRNRTPEDDLQEFVQASGGGAASDEEDDFDDFVQASSKPNAKGKAPAVAKGKGKM
ncbi:hypothetical protein DFP72DRAFT_853531 [Ephemerocybe angulata]|uniref:Nucleoplasmin-like domain-containing protein n=1 Tax=Ephemerocybe angulata TaxID=980116 RepID=A0A8H6HMH0_9AGAR|nr:hypothetical protein DFP72DRAFT_853531 [Tulosesus angulatus]